MTRKGANISSNTSVCQMYSTFMEYSNSVCLNANLFPKPSQLCIFTILIASPLNLSARYSLTSHPTPNQQPQLYLKQLIPSLFFPCHCLSLDSDQYLPGPLKQSANRFPCICPCLFPTDSQNATKVTFLKKVFNYVNHPPT